MPVDDDAADDELIAAAIALCRGERPARGADPARLRRIEHVIAAIIEAGEGCR